MINGEETECLLCGEKARRTTYKDAFGWKYECSECPPYALASNENSHIEHRVPKEKREKLSDYLKKYPPSKTEFKELDMNTIIRILRIKKPLK